MVLYLQMDKFCRLCLGKVQGRDYHFRWNGGTSVLILNIDQGILQNLRYIVGLYVIPAHYHDAGMTECSGNLKNIYHLYISVVVLVTWMDDVIFGAYVFVMRAYVFLGRTYKLCRP